ncbi:hypothetical protein LCGC14_0893610 [marine sediment metagenome]|uniref:Uncharacterized protein n=1 Tax=marine sediment metagenome TaxID=412755 RepID=A0A0F9PJ85_9ZZZZ
MVVDKQRIENVWDWCKSKKWIENFILNLKKDVKEANKKGIKPDMLDEYSNDNLIVQLEYDKEVKYIIWVEKGG